MRLIRAFLVILTFLLVSFPASAAPVLYLGSKASGMEKAAASELQRYWFVVSRDIVTIETGDSVPARAQGFVLGTPATLPALGVEWPFGLEVPENDGYILRSISEGGRALVIIAAPTQQGVQNGVYGLLDDLGFGFYLGGDTLPNELPAISALARRDLRVSISPVFAVRGSLPWYNFFNSPTAWELADHKSFIDQLAKMRCNFVGFHTYDAEPFAAYESDGKLVGGEPLVNTSKPTWGTQPAATSDFFAGTGQFFSRDFFGAESSFIENREQSIRAAKDVLRQALEYAKGRGLKTCLGFELHGDPLDPAVQAQFEARLRALIADYPMLDCVWLWEPEAMGTSPGTRPAPRSPWAAYTERWAEAFKDVAEEDRRAEAVRLTLFGLHANQVLKATRPDIQLVMSGWGGDQWLHCTDFYPGMDKILPPDVAFSALDNIRVTPTVSKAYDGLSATRQRWPILWFEFDGDQWAPQPNLKETAAACRDALKKGCQGLLGIHWRTRAVEESAAFCARFAWDPALTFESFCTRRARDLYGESKAEIMGQYLQRLQNLGYRWVGGGGQTECGSFAWSGGDAAKRNELAVIGYELRRMTNRPPLLGEGIVGDVSKIGKDITKDLTKLGQDLTKTVIPFENNPVNWLLSSLTLEQPKTTLDDLIAQIEYVLLLDHAASVLEPGGLDAYAGEGKTEEAVGLIRDSKLADAMQTYARLIRNKGELGVLATINAKAWADLRKRSGFDEATLASLEALPESYQNKPVLLVLPDRVIVAGLGDAKFRVVLKTRPLGAKRFDETELKSVGKTTYALTFPESAVRAGTFEYGIEVKGGRRSPVAWPPEFPTKTASANLIPVEAIHTSVTPEARAVQPVTAKFSVDVQRSCVQLIWDTRPGETYSVLRDGKPLATVADGWYEDASPISNTLARYTIETRSIISGQKATVDVSVPVPELPLPGPPKKINVVSRANRIILGWQSEEPNAAQYRVVRYDKGHQASGVTAVDAEPGQYVQVSDAVEGGQAYSYTVASISPDGRVGPPSKRIGILASTEPLEPVLRLSFKDESFLRGLARLATTGLALGGKGWAELPAQSAWDPAHGLTLSVWVKMDDLAGMPVLVCKGAWLQAGYFLQILNGRVRFFLAGVDTLDAGAITPGQWQLITATYGNGEMQMYVDGTLVGRKHVTGNPLASAQPLLVGRYGANDDIYFVRGVMDDVRIYDAALTGGEIRDLFEETKRP